MSPPRWSSTRHSSRADSKLQNTSPARCMTFTSSRSTKNSGRERSGAFRMHSLRHSRNWIRSHNSRQPRNSVSFWRLVSLSRSSELAQGLVSAGRVNCAISGQLRRDGSGIKIRGYCPRMDYSLAESPSARLVSKQSTMFIGMNCGQIPAATTWQNESYRAWTA